MLKNKAYEEISEELENMKKARKKFEKQMEEVEQIKEILIAVGEDMNKMVGIIDRSKNELKIHRKALLETAERVEKLEKRNKPSDDVMYK